MTIEDLKKTIEKIGLAVDEDSGHVLIEWEKIPYSDADRPYWAALSSIKGVGSHLLPILIAGFGSAREVFHQRKRSLQSLKVPEKIIDEIMLFKKSGKIPAWFQQQISQTPGKPALKFLMAAEENFPPLLRQSRACPSQLWVWGDARILLAKTIIAIVGTRKITAYGTAATQTLSAGASGAGIVVASGLMYGVDETAMRAAISAGRPVIGVWAGGLTRTSLGSRFGLARDVVASGGVVISEWPPDQEPNKGLFPARNRIVSGVSRAVLVVEGASKSGSLITARFGMEQGRIVAAVPGSIFSSLSEGPNELLKLGAQAVTSVQDLKTLLDLSDKQEDSSAIRFFYEPKNGQEARVLDILKTCPMTIDDVVRRAGFSVGEVGGVLIELEMAGAVRKNGDVWRVC